MVQATSHTTPQAHADEPPAESTGGAGADKPDTASGRYDPQASPGSTKKKRRKKKKRSVQAAAYQAAQEAARKKVQKGQPSTPLQKAILTLLGLLTVAVAILGAYLFFVQWPEEHHATVLSGDISAQVSEFERLQTRIDMEYRVLTYTLEHGHITERPELAETDPLEGEEGPPRGEPEEMEQAAEEVDAYELPTAKESLRNLAGLMRSAHRCIRRARQLGNEYLSMYDAEAMGYDSVHANLERLAETEPAFLERARELEALANDLGVSLEE